MKKFLPIVMLLGLILSVLVPMVAAQDVTVSDACNSAAVTDSAPPVDLTGSYLTGEAISISFGGTGVGTVDVDGSVSNVAAGDTFDYAITADASYAILVDGDATLLVTVSCTGADSSSDPTPEPSYPPGMICHFPPGNPENAHTITVGEPAVQTHVDKHGDTLGPCPEETDTKIENPDISAVIFVEPENGIVKVYSGCTEESCSEETIITLLESVDFALVTDGEGNFITVAEVDVSEEEKELGYIQFGEIAELGPSVVIYYLHPYPDNETLGVFQVNIYFDGVLANDETLLFVTADGTIDSWGSHDEWDA